MVRVDSVRISLVSDCESTILIIYLRVTFQNGPRFQKVIPTFRVIFWQTNEKDKNEVNSNKIFKSCVKFEKTEENIRGVSWKCRKILNENFENYVVSLHIEPHNLFQSRKKFRINLCTLELQIAGSVHAFLRRLRDVATCMFEHTLLRNVVTVVLFSQKFQVDLLFFLLST